MNKSFRQSQIRNIVRSKEIYTQDELARELSALGIQTTQVTLSRDVRELKLVKTADGYRAMPAETVVPDLAGVLDEYLLDIRVAQNLVVLRTAPGNANSVAIALDRQNWVEIVGTVAGDDTVLVVAPDHEGATRFQGKLVELLSG